MKLLKTIRRYYFYCGIEKEEYNELKKDAYVSNYEVWRILHFIMVVVFFGLFIASLVNDMMSINRYYYLGLFVYSVIAVILFYILEKDSLAAQLLIYLSMSCLFLFGCLISMNNPEHNATTFIAFLLVTPMFMIDKPFFMTIELVAASVVFLIWMYAVKPFEVWEMDFINVLSYTIIGCFLNVVANSIRIKEFVLTKKIRIQKDTDAMTGLRNKGALTREIDEFLKDESSDKGLLLIMDIDKFKFINDNYGHDIGDRVIIQFANFLLNKFGDELTGRFGGDEFILFVRNTYDEDTAVEIANEIINNISEVVELPDKDKKISTSIGIAVYKGVEKSYSEIFKKADIALYRAKDDKENRYCIYK
ncbi:diguanylate cyclase (GGDEF) domain-containing protein [Lachnospiraceae bacterium]|nr:diguanylate cyclase (GGDEF) domain-containing protein [Lachnospiraceae bacterium]